MKAFEKFEEINAKESDYQRQKAWLKDYEGLPYGIAIKGKHKFRWKEDPQYYSDKSFSPEINCIAERKDRTRIEFDDKAERGEKDKEKIKDHVEKTIEKLKQNNIGFIRSTHKGASDYLWVEFDREVTEKEKEAFIYWISPENAEMDLNFASEKKVFPVLYATHWKHSEERETPIEFFEGEKIDLKKLDIKISKEKILKRKIKNRSFEYVTGIKDASQVFKLDKQAEKFNEIQPLFYDRVGLFWLWNAKKMCWEVVDEVDLLNMINDATGKDVIGSKNRTEIINALKQEGRKSIPKQIKTTWIQFKNKIYDTETGESYPVTPEYFVTNPIPHEVNGNPETPIIDKIFEEWVGKEYVETLHEVVAYCLLPNYPINRLFCFIGGGMNGKTCFLNLLRKFVGEYNCCSTELDALISSRFEVTRLHKKLVCQMGETNFNEINQTSILKKLTGNDLIGFEYKNKTPFEDVNYAKILIATNNLPATTDKTIGFYRRWMIIDFPNQFSEKKDILNDIPDEEYENLATRSIITLNKLLQRRSFTNEGSVEERMKRYEEKSNFLERFIRENTEEDLDLFVTKNSFSKKFASWCKENRLREVSDMSLSATMKKLGYESSMKYFNWMNDGKGGSGRVWLGLRWKE
jgi:P4 family phage/plasmid primase-like protien